MNIGSKITYMVVYIYRNITLSHYNTLYTSGYLTFAMV